MKRLIFYLAAAALALAACSQSTQVGDPGLLERIKSPTASPSPTRTASPRPSPTAIAKPKASPTQVRKASTFELVIRDTRRGFEPQVFRVFLGTKVIFRNLDRNCPQRTTDPRCHHSWVADDGTWDSGRIPSGGSWPYVTRKVGRFRFHDGEVPYNIGQMEVLRAP